jgi:hypothetical protein
MISVFLEREKHLKKPEQSLILFLCAPIVD